MSTVLINCPECRSHIRVAVQPAIIKVFPDVQQVRVHFDDQIVAHKCKEESGLQGAVPPSG